MTDDALLGALFVLAPGFVAVKLFQIFGTQWRRTDWEWTVWSLVTGVLVAVAIGLTPLRLVPAQEFKLTTALSVSTDGIPERFLLAALLGLAAAVFWRVAIRSSFAGARAIHRRLINSAWDSVLDEVVEHELGVEVGVATGSVVERFFGAVHTFGYERTGARPWLYLSRVRQFDLTSSKFQPMERTTGVLLHADNVQYLRVARRQRAAPSGAVATPPGPAALAPTTSAEDLRVEASRLAKKARRLGDLLAVTGFSAIGFAILAYVLSRDFSALALAITLAALLYAAIINGVRPAGAHIVRARAKLDAGLIDAAHEEIRLAANALSLRGPMA